MPILKPIRGSARDFYQHTDGGIYVLIGFATGAHSLTEFAVYRHEWPFHDGKLWMRPIADFECKFQPVSLEHVMRLMIEEGREEAQNRIAAARAERKRAGG